MLFTLRFYWTQSLFLVFLLLLHLYTVVHIYLLHCVSSTPCSKLTFQFISNNNIGGLYSLVLSSQVDMITVLSYPWVMLKFKLVPFYFIKILLNRSLQVVNIESKWESIITRAAAETENLNPWIWRWWMVDFVLNWV